MKIKACGVMACVALLVLAPALLAATAFAQAPGIKSRLVGHWQLVSVSVNGPQPYGANPQGSMFLDADGHYSVIVLSAGNARSISFFGTYTVDDAASAMTLHIEGSSNANAGRLDQKRLVTFSGNEMIQDTPAGTRGSIKVTWKR